MVRFSCRDLSYETDSGPKTKTGNRPFSRPLKKLNNFLRHPKRRWEEEEDEDEDEEEDEADDEDHSFSGARSGPHSLSFP